MLDEFSWKETEMNKGLHAQETKQRGNPVQIKVRWITKTNKREKGKEKKTL